MAEATTAPARKGRKWLRILLWTIGGFVLLLVVLYLILSSGAFFKSVVLPQVGQALNADVSARDVSFSPFSKLMLQDVRVKTTGAEPLLTVRQVRVDYSLTDILAGKIHVERVLFDAPVIQIIEGPDGQSNLDPLLRGGGEPGERKSSPAQPAPKLNIGTVTLRDGIVRKIRNYQQGEQDLAVVSNVNLTLQNLQNGSDGTLHLSAEIRVDNRPPAPATNGFLEARLTGAFGFHLSPDLKPARVTGHSILDIGQAGGALAEVEGLNADLEVAVNPEQIQNISLAFKKEEARLANVKLDGPFDMAKTEGHLNLAILSLDREVLNLAVGAGGLDFGSTTINSTNGIDLAGGGSVITIVGSLNADKLSVMRAGAETPVLKISSGYNLTLNRSNSSVLVRAFTLNGTQNGQPLLHGELTSPMALGWNGDSNALGDAALKLSLTNLDLADWRSFTGSNAPSGRVQAEITAQSRQSGQLLDVKARAQIQDLTAGAGSNQIQQINANLVADAQLSGMNQLQLREARFELAKAGQPLGAATASGQVQLETKSADLQFTLDGALPGLLQAMPQPGAEARSGQIQIKSHLVQQNGAQTISGAFSLTNFNGGCGEYRFTNFTTAVDFEVARQSPQLEIRRLNGRVSDDSGAGGTFALNGRVNTETSAADLALKLDHLNRVALRPLLSPLLAGRNLVSAELNGDASVRYAPEGETAVKADLQVSSVVVQAASTNGPPAPLEARLQIDTTQNQQAVTLKECRLTLSPTSRARNEIALEGRLDLSQSNALTGNLKLLAESLDATPYFDLLSGEPGEPQEAPAPAAPNPVAAVVGEPEPVHWPVGKFDLAVNIGRFYLREVAISNWQASAQIEGSRIRLTPLALTLNGAPVKANVDLNLGVPGYAYDLNVNASAIPLAPLANSFSPTYKDRAKGVLYADAQFHGQGITGTNLQRSLGGHADVLFTNAEIEVIGPKVKALLTPIVLVLGAGELLKSPFNTVEAHGMVTNGTITVRDCKLVSGAFMAITGGEIPIADVITNSPIRNWPVEFHLRRSLAAKANLVPPQAPPDTAYVQLPTFIQVKGTLGDPKTDINKLALVGLLGRSATALPGSIGEKAGSVLKQLENIGGILPGTNSSGTNQTDKSEQQEKPAFNPLDLFKKRKQ